MQMLTYDQCDRWKPLNFTRFEAWRLAVQQSKIRSQLSRLFFSTLYGLDILEHFIPDIFSIANTMRVIHRTPVWRHFVYRLHRCHLGIQKCNNGVSFDIRESVNDFFFFFFFFFFAKRASLDFRELQLSLR